MKEKRTKNSFWLNQINTPSKRLYVWGERERVIEEETTFLSPDSIIKESEDRATHYHLNAGLFVDLFIIVKYDCVCRRRCSDNLRIVSWTCVTIVRLMSDESRCAIIIGMYTSYEEVSFNGSAGGGRENSTVMTGELVISKQMFPQDISLWNVILSECRDDCLSRTRIIRLHCLAAHWLSMWWMTIETTASVFSSEFMREGDERQKSQKVIRNSIVREATFVSATFRCNVSHSGTTASATMNAPSCSAQCWRVAIRSIDDDDDRTSIDCDIDAVEARVSFDIVWIIRTSFKEQLFEEWSLPQHTNNISTLA